MNNRNFENEKTQNEIARISDVLYKHNKKILDDYNEKMIPFNDYKIMISSIHKSYFIYKIKDFYVKLYLIDTIINYDLREVVDWEVGVETINKSDSADILKKIKKIRNKNDKLKYKFGHCNIQKYMAKKKSTEWLYWVCLNESEAMKKKENENE